MGVVPVESLPARLEIICMVVFNNLSIDKRQSEAASAVWEEQKVAFVTQLNVI